MVKKEITNEYLQKSILSLINTYGEDIPEDILEYVLEHLIPERDELHVVDVLSQVYDEMGVLEDDNLYTEFIELLNDNFDINQNIIEVGGGIFSRLGHRISQLQTKGKVVVYDPLLVMKKHDATNLILKKELFGYNTKLSGSKMLIGMFPCEATEIMIERACKENLDFQIYLCPCCIPKHIRESVFDYGYDEALRFFKKYYIDDISKKVSDSQIGKLEVASLQKCRSPLPVIFNKR